MAQQSTEMNQPLHGRVALVTGCGRLDGIGAATARLLSAYGAALAVTDRHLANSSDELDALASSLRASSGRAQALRGSVTSEADCSRVVEETIARLGGLDILVNNAGADHGLDRVPFSELALAEWQRVLEVNLTGTFLMCRAAVAPMTARKFGRIVNISSVAAIRGLPKRAAYAASKAGILGLTLSMAAELAPMGVTVNAVCPGPIETARARSTASSRATSGSMEEALAERARRIPVGRLGRPEDVAGAVAQFCVPSASFVTGQVLAVDGGSAIQLR